MNINGQKKEFQSMMIADNYLYIFLKNSFYLKLNFYGEIQSVQKLSSKLKTYPIFVDNSLMFINNKNKLVVID